MKHKRPVNLNLFTIRFPIPAVVSILHRISGVIVFLLTPFLIWGLALSLSSQQDFEDLHQFMTASIMKFVIWCLLSAFIYHLVAGVRHIIMDMGRCEELKSGRLSAQITIIISLILIVLAGIWLW